MALLVIEIHLIHPDYVCECLALLLEALQSLHYGLPRVPPCSMIPGFFRVHSPPFHFLLKWLRSK